MVTVTDPGGIAKKSTIPLRNGFHARRVSAASGPRVS